MIDLKFQKKQIDAYYFKFKKTVTYLRFLRITDFRTTLFNKLLHGYNLQHRTH